MTMEREPTDPLDENLGRLLKVAPERETMSGTAKERIAGRLRERSSAMSAPSAEGQNQDVATATGREPWKWRLAVAAAAAVLLFFGIEAVRNSAPSKDPGEPDHVVGNGAAPASRSPKPVDPGGNGGPPRPVPVDPGRAPVMVAPGETGTTEVAAPNPLPNDPLAVAGTLQLDESIENPPAAVTVWVRPMVPLPRVADAVRHDLSWGAAEEPKRAFPFTLNGALASARGMGAVRVLVHVDAKGAGSASAIHALGEGPLDGVTLVLSAPETATGFVIDKESQTAVAGAVVIAVDQIPFDALDVHPEKQGQLPSAHAVTDANGRFTLTGLRRTPTVRLRASAPGYGPGWETLLATGGAPGIGAPRYEGTIELGPGGRVFGLVEREDGTRWERAVVIVSRQDFDPAMVTRPVLTYGSALTDAEGRFEVPDLPGGLYVTLLLGDADGGSNVSPKAFELTRVKVGKDTEINFMSVQASARGVLRGVLRSADGSPLGGRSLTISLASAGSQQDSGWRATTTADDGSFTFADLDPGDYSLLHTLGGFREMASIWSGPISGPAEVDLQLPTAAVDLQGTPQSGTWPPDAHGAGAWAMVERLNEATGAWNFAGSGFQAPGTEVVIHHLRPGRYRATLLCDIPGLGFAQAGPFDVLDSAVSVPVLVPRGDSLSVRAVGPTGEPLPGVAVEVWPRGKSPWSGRPLPQQADPITGPEGRATLRGVPFGELEIRLLDEGQPVGSRVIEFRQGEVGTVESPVTVTAEGS